MEHGPSTSSILINVGVQALNLVVFFWIFKRFFAGKIIAGLQSRKELMAKLENADKEYGVIVSNAKQAAQEIIKSAQDQKSTIIGEAQQLATKYSQELLDQATNKAQSIIDHATIQATSLESQLKSNYETMVKTTAGSYIQKIFDKDPELQKIYIDKVTLKGE
ncbi:MAG TPA: ATP synthase F0 subunit B [Candidatus Absconditabacterales bacterium]|nr:ATP synthase F0 subunit B [Candidatus Absconditabacterales bacterium]HNG97808.1 ATP synthase F0 subunit B [Candidatus Absconditabacterales bacterium]